MYCPQCGNPLEGGNRYCVICGAPAPAANANTRYAASAGASRDAAATWVMPKVEEPTQPLAYRQDGPAPDQGGKPPLGIIIAVLAVVAVILGVILFMLLPAGQQQGGADASSQATVSTQQEASDAASSGTEAAPSESSSEAQPSESTPTPEQQAREAALASGKQVLEGTLHVTSYSQRAHEVAPGLTDFDAYDRPMLLLQLDAPVDITSLSAGSGQETETRTIQTFVLQTDDIGPYTSLNGQHVLVAIDTDPVPSARYWYSDVTGALADCAGAFQMISPAIETPQPAETQPAETPAAVDPNGDFVLVDSASRTYSKSELEALDNYTLFLARNEIFARHGCGFKSQELRDWFATKSWYRETLPSGSYGTEILNDTERANVNAMLEIEQARKSPYV